MNDTSDGERHIVVTQNGLADATYLDYLNLQYNDRLSTLTTEDSQRAFQDYLSDAGKRVQHDQQFPDEPKQVLPGENITNVNRHVQVSGMVAVMAINEKLLQTLMQKNPNLSFGLQESIPMKGTYADAVPLGPLMALGTPDAQSVFTPERAAQSLDYWRNATQQVLADPEATGSTTVLKSWSHDAAAAANLLAAHNYNSEAEQAYQLATQLWPANPDVVIGQSQLLARTGRGDAARQLLDDFVRKYPDQRSSVETFRGSVTARATLAPAPR